jgi:hypothetical protein
MGSTVKNTMMYQHACSALKTSSIKSMLLVCIDLNIYCVLVEHTRMSGIDAETVAKWQGFMTTLQKQIEGFEEHSADDIKTKYKPLIDASDELVQTISKLKQGDAEDFTDRIILHKFHDEQPRNPVYAIPIMEDTGGFTSTDIPLIFGMFLNRIIPQIKHKDVDVFVLCLGWNFDFVKAWWRKSEIEIMRSHIEEIVRDIIGSDAFKAIPAPTVEGGRVRTVIWLGMKGHAFGLVWDMCKTSEGLEFFIHPIDCDRRNDISDILIRHLTSELRIKYNFAEEKQHISINNAISEDIVQATQDFPCVPFLMRVTLYLSMLKIIGDKKTAEEIVRVLPNENKAAKKIYKYYETKLFDFADKMFKNKKLILMPEEVLKHKFVNINSYYLQTIGEDGEISTEKYIFNGFTGGFVSDVTTNQTCTTAAQFTNAISIIRECRLLIRSILTQTTPSFQIYSKISHI